MKTGFFVPSGWQVKKIPEVAFFQEGPGVRKHQYRDEGVKLLNVGNISEGRLLLNKTARYISKEEAHGKYNHFLVDDGDLIIGSSGITVDSFHKKIAYARAEHLPLCMNTSTIRFRSHDDNTLNLDFFRHFLGTSLFKAQLGILITGSAQLNFGPSHLKQMSIPIPPLAEQKRIAAILDKADAIRKKRQQAIALTEDFLRSAFLGMFGDPVTNPKGWATKSLREISTRFSDGPFGSNLKSSHYVESGVRVIRLQNIAVGEFVDKAKAYISEEHFDSLRKHECLPGDVIIGTMGEPNIRACILPDHIEFALNKADCIQMRIDRKKCTPEFVIYLLNHPGTLALVSHMLHGQTRVRVSMGTLRELAVPVPDINVQQKYSDLVISSRKIRAKQVMAEALAVENFNSLVQRAFRGEL